MPNSCHMAAKAASCLRHQPTGCWAARYGAAGYAGKLGRVDAGVLN